MNRPYIIQSVNGRFTLGFTVEKGGVVKLSGAFCTDRDLFKKRTGYKIVCGRLALNPHVILDNRYNGDNPFKELLVPLESWIRTKRFKNSRRCSSAILVKAAAVLDNAILASEKG